MSTRYLVFFTTPVEGGWKTHYKPTCAVVTDDDCQMPFGWQPEKIGDVYVAEINWIVRLPDGDTVPDVVHGEYDTQISFDESGVMVHPLDGEAEYNPEIAGLPILPEQKGPSPSEQQSGCDTVESNMTDTPPLAPLPSIESVIAENKDSDVTVSPNWDRVRKVISDHLGVEIERVTPTTRFMPEVEEPEAGILGAPPPHLGADSLDIVELVMEFEEQFGQEITDPEAEQIVTVADAVRLIDSKTHG